MEPQCFADPAEAIGATRAGARHDAAILDLQMPDLSGIDLAENLRSLSAESRTPIIIYSSISQFTKSERDRIES